MAALVMIVAAIVSAGLVLVLLRVRRSYVDLVMQDRRSIWRGIWIAGTPPLSRRDAWISFSALVGLGAAVCIVAAVGAISEW